MWLRHLEADRLRNLKAVSLDLSQGLTCVVGRNGQGKTTLLEAIYLLATGRSFRTRRQDDLTAWSGGPLRLMGDLESRAGKTQLKVLMADGERCLMADGNEHELGEYIGRLDLVDLTADRMKVLRGSPEDRRRFLDRGVLGLDPGYLKALGTYRRVIAQRNALLRQSSAGAAEKQLAAWDAHLIGAADELHRARRSYAVQLASRLGEIGRSLFTADRELCIAYRPSPAESGESEMTDFAGVYAGHLERSRARDAAVCHTTLGPHRDDLRVTLDGVDLRRFGSAGQVRAAMIALKLAKLSLLREERSEAPVFLMDDFDSDLDEVRASALAEALRDGGFQTLIASSKETLIQQLDSDFQKLRMDDGTVRPC